MATIIFTQSGENFCGSARSRPEEVSLYKTIPIVPRKKLEHPRPTLQASHTPHQIILHSPQSGCKYTRWTARKYPSGNDSIESADLSVVGGDPQLCSFSYQSQIPWLSRSITDPRGVIRTLASLAFTLTPRSFDHPPPRADVNVARIER